MIEMFILRHAVAKSREEWRGRKDSDRPLTTRGKEKMRLEAKAMRKAGLEFDLIVSSPFARASATAKIVAEQWGISRALKFSKFLTPAINPRRFLTEITRELDSRPRILVVGHEPYLSRLISLCLSTTSSMAIVLKKGGLCKLSSETRTLVGNCALEWLLTPDQVLGLR